MARMTMLWSSKRCRFQELYAAFFEELTGEEPDRPRVERDEELLALSRARAVQWRELNGK